MKLSSIQFYGVVITLNHLIRMGGSVLRREELAPVPEATDP